MTNKSIISLDIDGFDKWQSFAQGFKDFLAQQEKSGKGWDKEKTTQERITGNLQKQLQLMQEHLRLQREMSADAGKAADAFGKMESSSGGVLRNVLGIFGKLAGIAALAGGVAFAGYEALVGTVANPAAANRRRASGFGLRIGQERSFGLNFERAVDTGGFLSRLNEAELDVSKSGGIMALLGRGLSGDTSKDSVDVLQATRKLAERTPKNLLGTMSNAYGLGFSSEELQRIKGFSKDEWDGLLANYGKDAKTLDTPDSKARAYQDLVTQDQRTKGGVETAAANSLTRFVPAADAAAKSLAKMAAAADSFLNGDGPGTGTTGIGGLAHAARNKLSQLGSAENELFGKARKWAGREYRNLSDSVNMRNGESLLQHKRARERALGLPAGYFDAIEDLEGTSDSFQSKTSSATGRYGETNAYWRDYGTPGADRHDPWAEFDAIDRGTADAMKHFGGDWRKAMAAHNQGTHSVDVAVAKPGDWVTNLPREGPQYTQRGVKITIDNNTGGSAVAAAAQGAP